MENLSEDEALPNYSYQPQYNLHGLIDMTSLQHYQPDSQSHHSLHNSGLHTTNEIQAGHLTDYVSQSYGSLPHSTIYVDGQSAYPTTLSPVTDQQIDINSSIGASWPTAGVNGVNKNVGGRWSETRSQSQHRIEVGGIGWTDQLNKSMHRLMEVDMMCDTVIITNTNQIKVHRLILMSSSDHLLTLLKTFDNLKLLQLRLAVNISMEALKTFATFLYLGKANLTSENIRDVAVLANTFKIQVLKELIVKLSGDQTILNEDVIYDLQPMVLGFYEKRHQCTDTNFLIVTSEQGINTENEAQASFVVDDNNGNEENLGSCKKMHKKSTPTAATPHAYGTRSTVAPKGTPKSRRKTYIEEISKRDRESKPEVAVTDNQVTDSSSSIKEVYRGKKSRLLAGAVKAEPQETPKTRGKAKRKLEAENNKSTSQTFIEFRANNDISPIIELPDDTTSNQKVRLRKCGIGNQFSVRPPPKKRAKMALQLSEEQLFEDFDEDFGPLLDQLPINLETLKPLPPAPKPKKTAKKPPAPRGKRKRSGRWRQSKNLVGIADDIDRMAANIPEADRQFKCNLCGNEFVFSKRCISHMVKTHCIDETDVINNVIIRNKSESDPKVCDICGYKTKDQNFCYIHYHKYFKHGIPLPQGWTVYKCDQCGKECFTKFMLKDHKLIHKEETPFICETCGQGFKTRTCLNSHVFHRHKAVRKHCCTECNKTFKTRTQMNVHLRIHTGEKPFNCPHCDYKSTTRGNMRLHLGNKHKINTLEVQSIMDNMVSSQPLLKNETVIDLGQSIQDVAIQLVTVENAEIKASVHIDDQMKWTTIHEAVGENLTKVTPSILLPAQGLEHTHPTIEDGQTYTTYTLVPNSNMLEIQATPMDLLSQATSRSTILKHVESPQSSQQIYMQHSPISPAPTVSPEAHLKTSHNVSNSPITPTTPNSPYPTASNMVVNSPISPTTTNAYQTYSQNMSNSPISPPQPPLSPSQTYQSITEVSPVNLQTTQVIGHDGSYTDVTQIQVDGNYNSQQYDSALLQVYYHQHNFSYQPI